MCIAPRHQARKEKYLSVCPNLASFASLRSPCGVLLSTQAEYDPQGVTPRREASFSRIRNPKFNQKFQISLVRSVTIKSSTEQLQQSLSRQDAKAAKGNTFLYLRTWRTLRLCTRPVEYPFHRSGIFSFTALFHGASPVE